MSSAWWYLPTSDGLLRCYSTIRFFRHIRATQRWLRYVVCPRVQVYETRPRICAHGETYDDSACSGSDLLRNYVHLESWNWTKSRMLCGSMCTLDQWLVLPHRYKHEWQPMMSRRFSCEMLILSSGFLHNAWFYAGKNKAIVSANVCDVFFMTSAPFFMYRHAWIHMQIECSSQVADQTLRVFENTFDVTWKSEMQ